MLHLRLLGPLSVCDDDGRDLTPPGSRERNGLATLAVVSPDALSTERLAAELYRERQTSDPRNAVQAMVSRLRRALGRSAGSLETTTNGYRLVEVTVDVDDAERLLRAAVDEPDPDAAADLMAQAARLWHGSTLDGLDGELIEAERLRIDGLHHDAQDAVLERRVTGGATGAGSGPDRELMAALEAAVRDQPLREKRWELLMLALYRAGRQADALRAFQRARGLLGEHLGLDPGPALTDLEQRILAHDPTLTPVAAAGAEQPTSGAGRAMGSNQAPTSGTTGAPDPELPSGTLTVLLCDVEGSVRRWESDPGDAAAEIEGMHRRWTEAIEANRGRLVKSTGDGVLAVFSTSASAILAAARAVADRHEGAPAVRAAVHTGSLQPVDGDYRGPVVNRCARLLDLANGDQILVSGAAADLARADLATTPERGTTGASGPQIDLRDLGSHWLRDVAEPLVVWQVTGPGLRTSFPPLPSRDPAALPRPRAELLGRESLVDRVSGLVGDEPLVTLLGPGGIGKTSTALAVAWKAVGLRPVTFVDLARVDDPAAAADRIAEASSAGEHGDDQTPAERIIDRLRVGTDLVVIDNAEHVLDAVAEVVEQVVRHQLKGSFLITSRQPLGLGDEVIVGVPPLELPADDDDLDATGRSPSVQLFLARARNNRPDFRMPDGLLPVVAHICRRLDGIPLAIELAAGRASLLSIDDIAARLDDQLRLLRQVRSQRDRRHRSLEAVVGWSAGQLSPEGREVFDRLSVMAGGFGFDGAEAVLAHCGLDGIDVLEALDELHGASLLDVEPGGSRFRMLEPIRQFAAAELAERSLELDTRRAHARWMLDLSVDTHRRRDESRSVGLAHLDVEADHLRAAVAWIAESGQSDLAAAIALPCSWWFLTRDARTGERALRRLLSLADRETDPVGWAESVIGLAVSTAAHPTSNVAQDALAAVEIFDEQNHRDRGLARVAALFAQTGGDDIELPLRLLDEADRLVSGDDFWDRAVIDMASMTVRALLLEGGFEGIQAEELIERGDRAARVFRALDERWALGVTVGELGRIHQNLGDLEAAEACYVESLELVAGDLNHHGSHYVLTELGRVASARGQHQRAAEYHAEALQIAEMDGNAGCIARALGGLGHAAEHRGDVEPAIGFYRRALELVDDSILSQGRAEWQQALDRLEVES